MGCPTGALHFERTDDGIEESVPDENLVPVVHDGPLCLHGDIDITTTGDETLRVVPIPGGPGRLHGAFELHSVTDRYAISIMMQGIVTALGAVLSGWDTNSEGGDPNRNSESLDSGPAD